MSFLTARFFRCLVLINLVLIIASIISYAATVYSIVQWTHWEGQKGEIGGVLDYATFGESIVYHVNIDNQRGQRLFSFYDVTAYLMTAVIVFFFVDLAARTLKRAEPDERQHLAGLSLIVAVLSILSYRNTMSTISGKNTVLSYFFPLLMDVGGLNAGHFESSTSLSFFDITSWLFLALMFLTLILMFMQLDSRRNWQPQPQKAADASWVYITHFPHSTNGWMYPSFAASAKRLYVARCLVR